MEKINVEKVYNLSCDFALILLMLCISTLPNIKLNIPNFNTLRKAESIDSFEENDNIIFSLKKYPELAFLIRGNTVILSSEATIEYSKMNLSTTSIIEYSGMALSHELEDEFKKIALEYGIPAEAMLTIGDQESDGKWDNNGKISVTNDYGVFQINKRNHQYIFEHLGYTSDDLLNDPIKNAEAAAFLIRDIMHHPKVKALNDIFGMYNGWTGWDTNENAIEYVGECNERLECYFPDFEYDHSDYVDIEMEYYDDDYVIKLICEKACYNKHSDTLKILKEFKENIIISKPKYRQIVFDYNAIESDLIKMIESDNKTDKETWQQFYKYYLLQTTELLLQNKDDEAMSRYSEMVNALENYYGINDSKRGLPKNYKNINVQK